MSTFRSDGRDGLYGLLTGFKAAQPTRLEHAYRRRPGSFPDKRTGFVGPMPESIAHTGGQLSQRTMSPSVVIVLKQTEPAHEASDEMDDTVDAFITYANNRPHAISNRTVCLPVGVEDVELEADGAFYPAAIISFSSIALEGDGNRTAAAFVNPPTATPQAIATSLIAAGFLTALVPAATWTAETLAIACMALNLISVSAVTPATVTPQALALALIAAGTMAAS